MFSIRAINVPAGKTATIRTLAKPSVPLKIGDRMGPQGSAYLVTVPGVGSMQLTDIGDTVRGPGTWGVQFNHDQKWFYEGEGAMTLTVDASGGVTISGGAASVSSRLTAETGAVHSDLSAPQYGYDMVVGTTQASINATMKQWLASNDGSTFIACYVYKEDVPVGQSHYVQTDFAAFKTVVGFDPFDVPQGTPMTDPRVVTLQSHFFAFAFKTTMGLPTNFPLGSLPNIVVLDKGNSMVTYNLYCKNFEILALQPGGYGGGSWKNLAQATSSVPWVFTFNVCLDLYDNDSAFSHLPLEVQQQVKNLCPDSMFSVQQLYLDLNTAGLESAPSVTGLDPTSDAYIYLTRVFLNLYFADMQDKSKSPSNPSGNYLLGYTLKPTKPGPNPSIIPTDLNFLVSPYLDGNGDPTHNYELYTLNWLVMTESHRMPAPVQFTWNWVNQQEQTEFNGITAIRKGTFANFLNKLFSPSLRNVCLVPAVSMDVGLTSIKVKIGFTHDTAALAYNTVNDGSSKVLTFACSKSDSASGTFVPVWGNITVTTSVQSDVYLEGTTIRVKTTTTCWIHLNVEGGVSEGNIVQYTMDASYNVGVTAHGGLTVTPNTPVYTDTSHFDTSGWSRFVTFGDIDNWVKNVNQFWTVMKTFLTNEQGQILNILNGSSTWVFPGGKTFAFKNAQFSDYQDLVADVTYVDPSQSLLFNKLA